MDVMRAEIGDKVTLFDGRGQQAYAVICKTETSDIVFELIEKLQTEPPSTRIILIQALPRSKKMDLIVEKATELGAGDIWPVDTERAVSRPDKSQISGKLKRWRKIATSAAKQCGTGWIPEIRPLQSLKQAMIECAEFDLLLLGALSGDVKPFNEVLASIGSTKPKSIGIIIGPEGDFTPEEIEICLKAGAESVSFGDLVLRVETASIYALSILAYEYLWSNRKQYSAVNRGTENDML